MPPIRMVGIAISLLVFSACASITPRATNVTFTTGSEQLMHRRPPTTVFTISDAVVCYVDFQWPEVTQRAGRHEIEWQWFKEGSLISQGEKRHSTFRTSPWSFWSRRAAGSLGPGHYSVKVLLDGKVAASGDFEIG
jgi:hypothetical protein